MFNQLSGINAILYYLNDIFERAGFTRVSSDMQAVAIGVHESGIHHLAMTIIDRFGRKKLCFAVRPAPAFAWRAWRMVFATGKASRRAGVALVGFIAFFAFSQGAVIWVYLSEVFPTRVRAKGQSLGSFTHWSMNALISGVFPRAGRAVGRGAVLLLRGDDGVAVCGGAEDVSGNGRG